MNKGRSILISDLIARMDRWIAANRPEYYSQLQPEAMEAALDDFQSRFDVQLPESFRLLYRWRNGQCSACSASLQDNWMFSSLEDMTQSKDILDGMIGFDFEDPSWWKRGWVPFLDNGGGDHLCLDLDRDTGSDAGRVIVFWHEMGDRDVKYASLEDWLSALVRSMEHGTLELS